MTQFRPEQLEQLIKTKEGRRRFTLGMPKGHGAGARLTLLTPEGVSMLVSQGIDVLIQENFGEAIHYPDSRYSRAGARVASRSETLQCDVVLYDGQLDPKEASLLKPHSILLTLLHNRTQPVETIQTLLDRSITVVALDEVLDHRGKQPLDDILGEVSGRAAIVSAVSFLTDANSGKGILLGGVAGINPCEVVILGTGMSALAAARSAIGLGGMVRLFDSDPYCLRAAMSELGPAVIGSSLHPTVLGHALASADVVIATKLSRKFAIDNSVLDSMKAGVIIFDLNDRYGMSSTFPNLRCADVSDASVRGIIPGNKVCYINTVNTVPRTAAMAITNDIVPVVDRMFGKGRGLMNVLKADAGLRQAVVFFRGRVVNARVASTLRVKCVDINLLLSFS